MEHGIATTRYADVSSFSFSKNAGVSDPVCFSGE